MGDIICFDRYKLKNAAKEAFCKYNVKKKTKFFQSLSFSNPN